MSIPAGSYKMPPPTAANPMQGAVDMLDYGSPDHTAALFEILRRRRLQLDISCEQLDIIAGWGEHRASQIMSNPPIKEPKLPTLFTALGSMALRMRIEHDPEQYERIKSRLRPRKAKYDKAAAKKRKKLMRSAALHRPVTIKLLVGFLRQIGAKGGRNSRKDVGKRRTKQLARHAALTRWNKVREEAMKAETK